MRIVPVVCLLAVAAAAQRPSDTVGDVTITPIAHATLQLRSGDHVILVDPTAYGGWDGPYPGGVAPKINYEGLAAPTLVLVTDIHGDHLDGDAIAALRQPSTAIVVPGLGGAGWQWMPGAIQMANGQTKSVAGVTLEAVPMYNIVRGPNAATKFHTKGRGDGYIVTLAGKRIYISGDTECTPEMKALKNIDVAFVAMNLPFTATQEEAAECVAAFKPKIAYPYHYKGQDVKVFETKLAGSGVEVRLRDWYNP